jgi:hypothetical protein
MPSEDGKFVSTKPAAEPAKAEELAVKVAAEPNPKLTAPPSHTASPPPTRFSPAAKEAWASTPDEVRADVSRMEREFQAGFAKYKAAAERDASLDEFHARAAKGGTTVKEALSKHVALEDLLRADTLKGLELICKNAGVSLRDIAARVLGQATGNNSALRTSQLKPSRNSQRIIPASTNYPTISCSLSRPNAPVILQRLTNWRYGSISRHGRIDRWTATQARRGADHVRFLG